MLKADGFDDAIMGVCRICAKHDRLVYDYDDCVKILMDRDGMTWEEAIEYLVQKDIDPSVWRDYKGNRTIMKIVPVELIPSDRSFRNAWRIMQ